MAGRILAPGDILQVRAWCVQGEQASVNTFHYTVGAVTSSPDEGDMANGFDSIVEGHYKTIISNSSIYRGVQARVRNRTPLTIAQFTIDSAGAGAGGAVGMARQVCGISSWYTAYAGASYRGRTYWPFPAVSEDVDPGIPITAYVTALEDFCGDLIAFNHLTGIAGECDLTLGLRTNKIPQLYPIRSFLSHQKWATQRRRGSYGRGNSSPI